MFDRHIKSICSKRRNYQYLLGDCVYGCIFFLLRNGILLDLKQNTLFAIFFYVMLCNLLTYKMISLMQHLN